MKRALLLATIACLLTLAGCASAPVVPKEVLIPVVASRPVPTLPERPAVPVALRDKAAPDAEKARGLVIYIKSLEGYADALEALLAGYQHAPDHDRTN